MEDKKINNNMNFKMTTKEAIELIDMMKERVSESTLEFPKIGAKLEFDVLAKREGKKFIVSIKRGRINKKKCTYQGRVRQSNF